MIFYEVTVELDAEKAAELSPAFENYMRQKHIPEIYATGCFMHIRFDKASDHLFRTCYLANTQDDYERYIRDYAPAFRADFMQHFPTGCSPSRLVFSDLQTW